jgi:hypothetical protein
VIDGTLNKAGSITHKCQLQLHFKEESKDVNFFITDLGQDSMVLGFPFLQQFNPDINWEKKAITSTNTILITPKQLWEHQWKIWRFDRQTLPRSYFLKEEEVPHKYHNHQEVFSEEGAKQLPPSRKEDMSIMFNEGAPEQLDCNIYPLSKKKLEVLRQSLDEDVKKGYQAWDFIIHIADCFHSKERW